MRNKRAIGSVLLLVVQGLRYFPQVPHAVVEVLSAGAAVLAGSGALPSDEAVKSFGDEAK